MAQFYVIGKIGNDWMKGVKTRILIVLDNKQNFIGMKFHEGQVEYFGKNFLIILGSMEIQWKYISDVSQSQVYSYYLFTVSLKATLDRIIFKWLPLFKK